MIIVQKLYTDMYNFTKSLSLINNQSSRLLPSFLPILSPSILFQNLFSIHHLSSVLALIFRYHFIHYDITILHLTATSLIVVVHHLYHIFIFNICFVLSHLTVIYMGYRDNIYRLILYTLLQIFSFSFFLSGYKSTQKYMNSNSTI